MAEPLAIGEFARRSGLTISTLRFYDECGLLRPHRVDPSSGYRSYVPEQLTTALLIRNLRALGMPIADVRRVLDSPPPEQRAAVEARVQAETARLDEVRATANEVNRQISEMENMMQMVVRGDALGNAIKAAAPMVGRDPARPLLTGVLIEAREGSLRTVATDGYRLSVREVPALAGQAATFRGAVASGELVEWADQIEEGSEIAIEVEGDRLYAKGARSREFALIEGTYPDYEVILAVRDEWFPAIVRAVEFERAVAESRDDPVRLSFGDAGVKVEGVDPEVAARYDGPQMELAIDRGYLRDVLAVTTGPDVAIEISDPTSAVYFRSADDATSVTLVMPLRP